MKAIGTCDVWWDEECKSEWKNADRADFLDITDLFRALEMDNVKNDKDKEKDVRLQIWWTFNDRVREGEKLFAQEKDEVLWKQNCQMLIKLLDTKDDNQKIMTAELYRNLGEFKKSIKVINSIDKEYNWLIKKLTAECKKRNTLLIELNSDTDEEVENFDEKAGGFGRDTIIIATIIIVGLISLIIFFVFRRISKKRRDNK